MRTRALCLTTLLLLAACGGPAPDLETTGTALAPSAAAAPTPTPAELEAAFGPRDPTVEADPVMLAYCRAACVSAVEVWEAFCAAVPEPGTRGACWGTYFLGQVACQGWCYWQWGT